MSENTYEYECMRAELLGIEKPNYDEFLKNKKEVQKSEVEEEEIDIENIKEIEAECSSSSRISGRLEELNSILKKTQTKINRFKNPLGSLMTKVSERWNSQSSLELPETQRNGESLIIKQPSDDFQEVSRTPSPTPSEVTEEQEKARKSDLAKALANDLSKLDTMIELAENANYSMKHQSKQMKSFLK